MKTPTGKLALTIAAAAYASFLPPVASSAHAQRWNGPSACFGLEGRDKWRCERKRDRWDHDRRERERDRRKDAKRDGIVAGAIGAVVVGGVVAAIASSGKKKNENNERRRYCIERYGNYDERSGSYRASDGRWYRCE